MCRVLVCNAYDFEVAAEWLSDLPDSQVHVEEEVDHKESNANQQARPAPSSQYLDDIFFILFPEHQKGVLQKYQGL